MKLIVGKTKYKAGHGEKESLKIINLENLEYADYREGYEHNGNKFEQSIELLRCLESMT